MNKNQATSGLCSLLIATLIFGCSDGMVRVPPLQTDTAPVVSISNFVVGGNGAVDLPVVQSPITSTETVRVLERTELMFWATAVNKVGGIRRLNLTVQNRGETPTQILATGGPDGRGLVPDTLRILGSGPSGNIPIKLVVRAGARVIAEADNFNGQRTTLTAEISAIPPLSLTFTANPASVPATRTSMLSWRTTGMAQVSIDTPNGDPLIPVPAPATGSFTTSPLNLLPRDRYSGRTITYRIAAQSIFGETATASADIRVTPVVGILTGAMNYRYPYREPQRMTLRILGKLVNDPNPGIAIGRTDLGPSGVDIFKDEVGGLGGLGDVRQIFYKLEDLKVGTWQLTAQVGSLTGPVSCTTKVGAILSFYTIERTGGSCETNNP